MTKPRHTWTNFRRVKDGGQPPAATRLVPAADPEIEALPRGSAERIAAQHRAWADHFSRLIAAPGEYPPKK
jgi:hypothetical protein